MSSEDKKQTMRNYYVNNKDKLIDCFKTYYQDNYAKIRERNRKYYWDHVEERREYARVMHLRKHKGSIKETGPEQCYKYRKMKRKQETEVKEDKEPDKVKEDKVPEKVDKIVVSFG